MTPTRTSSTPRTAHAPPAAPAWRYTDAARARLPAEAARARALAARHCRDCGWYHGSWTTWRALELGSGADLHRGFFRDRRPPLPRSPRVLVGGAGDSALLAVALDALAPAQREARVHVVDRCETPLLLCREFAADHGIGVETHACDLLDFAPHERFDLVLVHALLGFVAAQHRPALFRRWHDLLAPGGHLMLVQRLRPGAGATAVRFDPEQASRFEAAVRAAADAAPGAWDLTPAALARAARDYARGKLTYPVDGECELAALLADARLRTAEQIAPQAAAPPRRPLAGPSLRADAPYALVVAMRDDDAAP